MWWLRKIALVLGLTALLLSLPLSAKADEPSAYENYLLRVMCARQRCLGSEASEVWDALGPIIRPIKDATSIVPDERITFFVTLESSPNAWALKHYVGVTGGLLRLRLSRDELAFVLSHELAHIELGHYQQKIDEVTKIYVIAAVLGILSQGQYNALRDPNFVTVARIALAAYSRDQETQADARGVRLMRSAGFDPQASISALLKINPLGLSGTGDLFDSHPSTAQRISRLQTEVASLQPVFSPPPVPQPAPAPLPAATPAPPLLNDHTIVPGNRVGPVVVGMSLTDVTNRMGRPHDETGRSVAGTSSYYTWNLDRGYYQGVVGRIPWITAWVDDGNSIIAQIDVTATRFATRGGNGPGSTAEAFVAEFGPPTSQRTSASGDPVWRFGSAGLSIAFEESNRVVYRVIVR